MSTAAIAIAFSAGLFSFLSPCIVPMLSVYFSLITGESFKTLRDYSAVEAVRKGVLRSTLAFVAGFFIVFTAAGAAAAQVGALFQQSLGVLNVIGGLFVIGLGLMMIGLFPQNLLQRLTLRHRDMENAPQGPRTWSGYTSLITLSSVIGSASAWRRRLGRVDVQGRLYQLCRPCTTHPCLRSRNLQRRSA